MSRIVIIANPRASGGRDPGVLEGRADRGPDVTLRTTERAGDARRLAREAVEGGAEVVVAAGGDGTVHEVAAGLLETGRDAALGVIPMGTGNDLARSLSLPADLEAAMDLIEDGRERRMDLVRVELDDGEPRICVNAASGGFSGEVHDALDADVKTFWGPLAYLRSAVEALGGTEAWDVTLAVDGREERRRVLNVVVANGRFAGGGVPIAPGADLFDGVLDVVVIGDASVLELSRVAPRLLAGEDPDDERFRRASGREVTLVADRPMPFSVDGERTECRRARFTLLEARLRVRV